MQSETFSTHGLRPGDQFDAWCSWFAPIFDVRREQSHASGFKARSEVWTLNGFALSRVSAPPIHVTRTERLIRRNPLDHWVITLGGSAATGILTANDSVKMPAGVPFVLSLGDELVSERGADDRLQLYLSRDTFRDIAPLLDAARGIALGAPLGSLLADYMLLLERWLPNLDQQDSSRLTDSVRSMVAACLAPFANRFDDGSPHVATSRLERVRQAVREHLRSEQLGAGMLCRKLGTSRSNLYRLMEGEGGIARYIQRQRLLQAYATICDPSNARSIAAIATELCFADASAFSRAFRREFSVSPSEARDCAHVGQWRAGTARNHIGMQARSLGDCVRSL